MLWSLQVIKHVLDAKKIGLKLEPLTLQRVCFSNIDYARDPINRMHIGEFMLNSSEVSVSWQLKAQQSMAVFCLEAEGKAMLDAL